MKAIGPGLVIVLFSAATASAQYGYAPAPGFGMPGIPRYGVPGAAYGYASPAPYGYPYIANFGSVPGMYAPYGYGYGNVGYGNGYGYGLQYGRYGGYGGYGGFGNYGYYGRYLPPNPPSPYYVAPSGAQYLQKIDRNQRQLYQDVLRGNSF
jgi:hypothetical protein